MLAEVRPEYVFKTIDPAVIPEQNKQSGTNMYSWDVTGWVVRCNNCDRAALR